MPTLDDVVREHTDLGAADLEHLHRLLGDWQLLADLSFADLLLWLPVRDGRSFVVAAQIRPTTGPTAFLDDRVGEVACEWGRPQVVTAWREGRICRETDPEWIGGIPAREEAIPVRCEGRVVAVVARYTNLAAPRTPSRLELAYLQTASDLAQMVADGTFPYPGDVTDHEDSPRVGDGMLRLDHDGAVVYASPNALSAYRRIGLTADPHGARLGEITAALAPSSAPVDEALVAIVGGGLARETDVESGGGVVRLRAIPLLIGLHRIGTLVLVRDITELRRRDVELLSKDATIREIHHRVKNNLQTVAALLRLQARRLTEPAGRAALEEAVRRVGSIALVHETLAQSLDETVAFDEVGDRVVAMVRDLAEGSRVRFARAGRFGALPAHVATPLAMVLTELLQNALEHGFPDDRSGSVEIRVVREDAGLTVRVADDGAGLPAGFALGKSDRLGLQIVRTLVTGELGGQIALRPAAHGGTEAVVTVPVARLLA